tara:strand:+ start:1137 stop:2150 length:1014 start_codon:yes stop_codon:yes gene_type:complete
MEIIQNYDEKKQSKNLLYLAKPVYGGWVTFTAHLSKKYNWPIFKITKKTEKKKRNYGYDCNYQNLNLGDILQLENPLITAVDKHYWQYLHLFPKDTEIIIHDPTECKPSKQGNPLIQSVNDLEPILPNLKVITIRESVQDYLSQNLKIDSRFLKHPFYNYPKNKNSGLGYKAVSIARIDFDKNTDIILKANQLIQNKENHIYLFGSENRIYVHHKLKDLNIQNYWKGKFPKNLEPTYENKSILKDAKYMIDLSIIKGDGGGTQYTFLEAIYQDCILILHNEWINKGSVFQSGINCIGVSNEEELSNLLNNDITAELSETILKNSQKIIEDHISVNWL